MLRQAPVPEARGRVLVGSLRADFACSACSTSGPAARHGALARARRRVLGALIGGPLGRGLSAPLAVPVLLIVGASGCSSSPRRRSRCSARSAASSPAVRASWPAAEPPATTSTPTRRRRSRTVAEAEAMIDARARRGPDDRAARATNRPPTTPQVAPKPRKTARAEGRRRPAADRPAGAARARRRRRAVHPAVAEGPRRRCAAPRAHQGERRGDRLVAAGVRRVRRRLRRDRLRPRADRDALPGRARPGREGRADHQPAAQHRLRGEERRGADPVADPGTQRGRRRDPERRPRGGHARRRAALADRAARSSPDAGRARQGRRGRLHRREPDEDAAPARRGRDRRRQVVLHQHADPLGARARDAGSGAHGAHRSQAGGIRCLPRDSAPGHAGDHECEEGRGRTAVGRARDGHALRGHGVLRCAARRRLQPQGAQRRARGAAGLRARLHAPTRTCSSSSTSSPT